jgi:sec-independent protein translocase protein TatA
MFGGKIGLGEALVILVVLLLIFGPAKLPQLGRSIGESIREFKNSLKTEPGEEAEKKPEQKG